MHVFIHTNHHPLFKGNRTPLLSRETLNHMRSWPVCYWYGRKFTGSVNIPQSFRGTIPIQTTSASSAEDQQPAYELYWLPGDKNRRLPQLPHRKRKKQCQVPSQNLCEGNKKAQKWVCEDYNVSKQWKVLQSHAQKQDFEGYC